MMVVRYQQWWYRRWCSVVVEVVWDAAQLSLLYTLCVIWLTLCLHFIELRWFGTRVAVCL